MYVHTRYCYLPLLWKSWNWFDCGVEIVLICLGAVADVSTFSGEINIISHTIVILTYL